MGERIVPAHPTECRQSIDPHPIRQCPFNDGLRRCLQALLLSVSFVLAVSFISSHIVIPGLSLHIEHCSSNRWTSWLSSIYQILPEKLHQFMSAEGLLASSSHRPATLLYVSSYSGTITTLSLNQTCEGATLTTIQANDGCFPNPSWITLDHPNALLYCVDEGLSTPNGTLASFKTGQNGTLALLDEVETISGPVSAVIYGHGGHGLALAHYTGSSVSAFNISNPSRLTLVGSETFSMPRPGPNPSRQDAPHPHQAVLDPTGQFILVPDLGADLVRVFLVNNKTLQMMAVDPLVAAPGSGPRHVAFLATSKATYMYLISELANTITVYLVVHGKSSITFQEVYSCPTHGDGRTVPAGATGAEIVISPDGKFLLVSSRGEGTFRINDFNPATKAKIPSDPLINFSIDQETGKVDLVGSHPAGGMMPRQFTMNKAGTIVAVGLQNDGRVVLIERNPSTGQLGEFLAYADVPGPITSVNFGE